MAKIKKRSKIYYTKGEVRNGLYTSGSEWMDTDGNEYVGQYHQYLTEETFTEASFVNGVSYLIIPFVDISKPDKKSVFEYDSVKTIDVPQFEPLVYTPPNPTASDYRKGSFTRYFVNPKGSSYITEVSLNDFSKALPLYYNKVSIVWKLTSDSISDLEEINRNSLRRGFEKMPLLESYITNFREFSKIVSG